MQEQRAHLPNVFFIKKFCGCRKVLDLFSHSTNDFSGDVFMEQQVDPPLRRSRRMENKIL